MAINFPRFLPTLRFRPGSTLELTRQLVAAPTRGGLVQVAEVGRALWTARYQTVSLTEADGAAWEAWISTLRGGAKQFRAVHPWRRLAQAYPGGYGPLTKHTGGNFTGAAVLDAVAVALDAVTISGLPTDFAFTVGDLLSFPLSGGRYSMHRVVESVTASAGVATVTVEPTVPPGATINGTVATGGGSAPYFLAVIDDKATRIEWSLGRRCQVTIQASQSLT